jgi:hypothetical protein
VRDEVTFGRWQRAALAVVLLALATALLAVGGIDDHGDRVRQLTPTSAEVARP